MTRWSDKVWVSVQRWLSNKVILQKTIWKVGRLRFAARNQTNFAIWSEVWNKTIFFVDLRSIFMKPAVYDTRLICLEKDDDLFKSPLFYPPNVAWKTCQFCIFAHIIRSSVWDELGAGLVPMLSRRTLRTRTSRSLRSRLKLNDFKQIETPWSERVACGKCESFSTWLFHWILLAHLALTTAGQTK